MIRAVVDPSVLVSAFIGDPGAGPCSVVEAWRDRRFVLVVSPVLLDELAEVLSRPKFARWSGDGRSEAYVAGFAAGSERQPDPTTAASSGLRDPDDEYLVALARAAGVDAIVSLDRDLLDAQLDDVAVMDPAAFVGSLEQRLVLERYRLVTRLGAGPFGVVWRAWDERFEREVVVKMIATEHAAAETRAAARLAHPTIVSLYEAGMEGETTYLVSELVRGRTLADLLADSALSDREVVQVGLALCQALAHAHAQGVVHRDVKPSNVLVPDAGLVGGPAAKLADFSIATVVGRGGDDLLTRTGDIVGTLAYMAPEQADGRDAGPPADLYAAALVLYEAFSGVHPIRGGTAVATARRIGAAVPSLRVQRQDLPVPLGDAIDRALVPDPRERGTVAHLHEALKAALP